MSGRQSKFRIIESSLKQRTTSACLEYNAVITLVYKKANKMLLQSKDLQQIIIPKP